MRVFVTGGTGFVGTAVIKELLSHGHQVIGLARGEKGAEQLKSQGVQETLQGTLEDLEVLKKGASESDAVLHLAFVHDFSNFQASCAIDQAAISAMGSALAKAGGNRPLIVTSGTMMLAGGEPGKIGTEDDPPNMSNPLAILRGASEAVCLDFAKQGVGACIIRLPPTVHGPGLSGFTGIFANIALQKGVSAYVGEGSNCWSACHRDDAAKVYRLAMEKAQPGSVFHAVAEQGVPLKEIATEVGNLLKVPTLSIGMDKVQDQFDWFSFGPVADNVASSEKTRTQLDWTPTAPTLIENMPIIVDFAKSHSHTA